MHVMGAYWKKKYAINEHIGETGVISCCTGGRHFTRFVHTRPTLASLPMPVCRCQFARVWRHSLGFYRQSITKLVILSINTNAWNRHVVSDPFFSPFLPPFICPKAIFTGLFPFRLNLTHVMFYYAALHHTQNDVLKPSAQHVTNTQT